MIKPHLIMKKKFFFSCTLILIGLFCTKLNAQTTLYVDSANVNGTHDGMSWTTAYNNFQAAINISHAGDNVFVAKGTYIPKVGASFSMKEGVKIYGGFKGNESSLTQRDLTVKNSSILKGNHNRVLNNSRNNLSAEAVLDGFTITGGGACDVGGGMYNDNSSPLLTNLNFDHNTANLGGGMSNKNSSSPQLINVNFNNNTADIDGGGGMFNYCYSSPTLTNATFSNNTAVYGGGMFNEENSSPMLINATFYNNTADVAGGIYNINSTPKLTFCVFNNNTSTLNKADIGSNSKTNPIVTQK